jgi:hypothetical protein
MRLHPKVFHLDFFQKQEFNYFGFILHFFKEFFTPASILIF